ncbi:MAG: hypothetical protein AB1324_05640 [Candidatus Micrarchaeota archaeon]
MESQRPARERTNFGKAKDRFRAALLAGSLLLPSAAYAQDHPPDRAGVSAEHREDEHRHPESERFSPGPLLIMRSSAYRVAGALHEDRINPRAVVPFSGGVSATYNIAENSHPFFRFMVSPGRRDFSIRPLSYTLALQYDHFRFRDLVTHRDETSGNHEERPAEGTGNAISLTPAISLGAGLRGVPMELILYGNFGFRNWSSRQTMSFSDGTSDSVGMSSSEGYVGLYGIELRFPTVPCEPAFPFRLERLGIGAFGDIQNVLAYLTVSGNYLANHRMRLRTMLTPQVTNFAGEVNAGGELIPLEMTFYLPHGLVSIAPGMRAEYNFASKSPVIEAFGDLRYFPFHSFGIALRGGWLGDVSGNPHPEGEPSSAFGSLNLIFNIDGTGPAGGRFDVAGRGG